MFFLYIWLILPFLSSGAFSSNLSAYQQMNISSLLNKGLTGKNVKIAVIEPSDASLFPFLPEDLKDKFLNGSENLSFHGAAVTSLIVSEGKKCVGSEGVAKNASILYKSVPLTSITYLFEIPKNINIGLWNKEDNDPSPDFYTLDNSYHLMVVHYTSEQYKILVHNKTSNEVIELFDIKAPLSDEDIWIADREYAPRKGEKLFSILENLSSLSYVSSWPNQEYHENMVKIFNELIAQNIKIVNLSMSLFLNKESIAAIQRFSRAGGIIVMATGNDGISINKDISNSFAQLKVSGQLDADFYTHLKNNFFLKDAFLFVGNLSEHPGKLSSSSNLPGDLITERFISVRGTALNLSLLAPDTSQEPPPFVSSCVEHKIGGTSLSAPIASGTLALLKEENPDCPVNTLANALLDTADPLGGTHTSKIFGRGRLNAAKASEMAKKYCQKVKLLQSKKK